MRDNINFSSHRLKPIELVALSKHIVTNMTGNANFPTPKIALADITAKANELDVAINIATEGSKSQRIHRDVLFEELVKMLRVQADYIRAECDGNKAMLNSSGYTLSKKPEPIGTLGTTMIKDVVMTGITGQVELKWKSVRGAQLYQVWVTEGDPKDSKSWQVVAATHRVKTKIDNLKSLNIYWFAVSAIGAAGEGAKCDPAFGVAS